MKVSDLYDVAKAVEIGTESAVRQNRSPDSSALVSLSDTLGRTRECLHDSMEREKRLRERVHELEAEVADLKARLASASSGIVKGSEDA